MPKHVVTLEEGEYAKVPNDKNHVLIGPGKLSVTRRSDGRVYGHIVEGEAKPIALALKRKLRPVGWGI